MTPSRPPSKTYGKKASYRRGKSAALPSSKHQPSPVPSPTSLKSSETPLLDKDLVLKIILAKLEASKTCDWFVLSQRLDVPVPAHAESKGSKGEEKMSGNELRELYLHRILPALKAGKALWADDDVRDLGSSTLSRPDGRCETGMDGGQERLVGRSADNEEEDAGERSPMHGHRPKGVTRVAVRVVQGEQVKKRHDDTEGGNSEETEEEGSTYED
ncbi:hypothetical protein IAU60_002126 [Kwoniella sp. DSM 27419]